MCVCLCVCHGDVMVSVCDKVVRQMGLGVRHWISIFVKEQNQVTVKAVKEATDSFMC